MDSAQWHLAEQGLKILVITWSDSGKTVKFRLESIHTNNSPCPSDPDRVYGQQLYARATAV
jgi:hypothetical protein